MGTPMSTGGVSVQGVLPPPVPMGEGSYLSPQAFALLFKATASAFASLAAAAAAANNHNNSNVSTLAVGGLAGQGLVQRQTLVTMVGAWLQPFLPVANAHAHSHSVHTASSSSAGTYSGGDSSGYNVSTSRERGLSTAYGGGGPNAAAANEEGFTNALIASYASATTAAATASSAAAAAAVSLRSAAASASGMFPQITHILTNADLH